MVSTHAPHRTFCYQKLGQSLFCARTPLLCTIGILVFALSAFPQARQIAPQTAPLEGNRPGEAPIAQFKSKMTGTVVDSSGAVVVGAHVTFATDGGSQSQQVLSDSNGQFAFDGLIPGAFRLTVEAEGFAPQISSGILKEGETLVIPQIELAVAPSKTDVQVSLSPIEVAQEEIKDEEKQRVLGVLPNFYVTYDPHPQPLIAKQKFSLAWKMIVDPATFGVVGLIAGVQQANNSFRDYGQGASGYGKRYAASYADLVSGTIIGAAILPSVLKQDPRYFYKGGGSTRSRTLYALANSVVCKGDNGRWQANYSNILGSLAAGGISNLYYPASDRNGARLTFENAAVGIGATGIVNVLQEFVISKVTRGAPKPPSD